MKGRIFFWSITSALAGFLFGFDTVVISGAEQTIQSLWEPQRRHARAGDGRGALRHGARLAARRLADGPLRAQADAALDRRALPRLGGRLRLCVECLVVHRRAIPRRHRHRHLHRRRAALHLGDRAAGASRTARGHVPVQHRLRHPRRLPLELAARAASVKMRGAGCSASRRSRRCSTR